MAKKTTNGIDLDNVKPELLKKVQAIVEDARTDAIDRTSHSPQAIERINNALQNRFFPHVLENEIIAEQIDSSEYVEFADEINEYLDALVGFVACPDGRIVNFSLASPLVGKFHRKLQGLPEIRPSTSKSDKYVLNNPELIAYVRFVVEQKLKHKQNPEVIEFMGPHILSGHPLHGCGAATAKIVASGKTPELGMRFGGIAEYFEELKGGFFAFDYVANVIGGRGTTFDLTHDAYSQGFIIGLRDEYKNFDLNMSLRENLLFLAREARILMTETLDKDFSDEIKKQARRHSVTSEIELADFKKFSDHAILIGKIARALTDQEGKNGFLFIPGGIKEGKSETAVRALAYHALRNSVYRILGGIKPGNHRLMKHPEQLIRVGPVGADYNIKNIPFIENIPGGSIRPEDMARVKGLYNLSYGILKDMGVDFAKEGRITLVTEVYEAEKYKNEEIARAEFHFASQIAINNSAMIRLEYKDSIQTGETIVIGALYQPHTRRLTHIV